MAQLLLVLVGASLVVAIGLGIAALTFGGDPGLVPTEPDGKAVPLPRFRPLVEADIAQLRFDTGLRGYRMAQVDAALSRAAYDLGYKEELINVLEAEVAALRDGRLEDADALGRARQTAARPSATRAEAVTDAEVLADGEEVADLASARSTAGPDPADDFETGADPAVADARQREETRIR